HLVTVVDGDRGDAVVGVGVAIQVHLGAVEGHGGGGVGGDAAGAGGVVGLEADRALVPADAAGGVADLVEPRALGGVVDDGEAAGRGRGGVPGVDVGLADDRRQVIRGVAAHERGGGVERQQHVLVHGRGAAGHRLPGARAGGGAGVGPGERVVALAGGDRLAVVVVEVERAIAADRRRLGRGGIVLLEGRPGGVDLVVAVHHRGGARAGRGDAHAHGAVAVVDGVVDRLGPHAGAVLHMAQDQAVVGRVRHPGGEVDHDRLVVGGGGGEGDLARDHVLVGDGAGPDLGGGVHHAGVRVDRGAHGRVLSRAGLDAAHLHRLPGARLPAEDGLDEAGHAHPGGVVRGHQHERAVGVVTPDDRLPGAQLGGVARDR